MFKSCRGVTVETPHDIRAAMWEKFVAICSFSGLGAISRMPVGVMCGLPELRALMIQCMEEVCAVGRAHGVQIPADTIERVLAVRDRLPPQSTASMQRDIMQGLPSELEWQTGAVVRLAHEKSVPVPVNEVFYSCLLPSELKARGDLDGRLRRNIVSDCLARVSHTP